MQASQIKAIAQVGSIVVGAIRHAEDPAQVLAPLRAIAAFDAAMLAVRDPLTGRQRAVVNEGYDASLLSFINQGYLSCPTYEIARSAHRPMRMRDYGPDFYRTRVYREFLEQAGYREGVTLVLRAGRSDQRPGGAPGRVTGLLTMSFADSRVPDDSTREGLEFVAPCLGQLVDVSLTPGWLASLLGSDATPFLVDARGKAVPTSDTPMGAIEQLSTAVLSMARTFLASGSASARGYCPRRGDAQWNRVHLVRLSAEHRGDLPRALLMLKQEPLPCRMTERELEVLTLVSQGLSNPAVAAVLGTSPRTVSTHVEHLLLKTGLISRAGLAAFAVEHGAVRLGLNDVGCRVRG